MNFNKNNFKQTQLGQVPEDWEAVPLKSFVKVNMGQSPKSEYYNETGNGIPFLQGVRTFGDRYPKIDTWCTKPTKIVEKDTVLMSVRAPVGAINKAPKKLCIGRGLCGLNTKNNDFLYYTLKYLEPQIKGKSSGTVYQSINKKQIEELTLPKPKLKEQTKIAEFLKTLDQKIELNRKMNETLEEIGKAIFKHWFIDFEFPWNFEKNEFDLEGDPYKSSGGEMKDSEIGRLPINWEIKKIQDVCRMTTNGGTPRRSNNQYWENGTINWFKTGELSNTVLLESEEKMTKKGLENSSAKVLPPNSVIIAIYASPTVGRLGILKNGGATNQACTGLAPDNSQISYIHLYYWLLSMNKYFNSIARGAAQQNISKSIITNSRIAIPESRKIIKISHKFLESLWNEITSNKIQNNELTKIRDLLLPRLMSGRIRIT